MNLHREKFKREYQHSIHALVKVGCYDEAEEELRNYEQRFGNDGFTSHVEFNLHNIKLREVNQK